MVRLFLHGQNVYRTCNRRRVLRALLALCGYRLDYYFSRRVPYGIRNVRHQTFNLIRYENMSGHSEDPVSEESSRFFTFFNLSMILVAITGVELSLIHI